MNGIKELQRLYDKQYKGRDLNPIWGDLLECSAEAMTQCIGEMRMIYKRLPDPFFLLQQVQKWQLKINSQNGEGGSDAGAEYLRLLSGFLAGRIGEKEFIMALYALADKHKRPSFAVEARRREDKLKGVGNGN